MNEIKWKDKIFKFDLKASLDLSGSLTLNSCEQSKIWYKQ